MVSKPAVNISHSGGNPHHGKVLPECPTPHRQEKPRGFSSEIVRRAGERRSDESFAFLMCQGRQTPRGPFITVPAVFERSVGSLTLATSDVLVATVHIHTTSFLC